MEKLNTIFNFIPTIPVIDVYRTDIWFYYSQTICLSTQILPYGKVGPPDLFKFQIRLLNCHDFLHIRQVSIKRLTI